MSAIVGGAAQFCIDLFHLLVEWLVGVIGAMGYPGVIMLMFLESSFFPFPSEVVMPPAGYLANRGEMSLLPVILCGVIGSLFGALFNYWIAVRWGRRFFERYGRYFRVSPEALDRAEAFFGKHGHVSTFTARLLPVIRQYVSLPAGLARMNLVKFCVFTGLGSGIWVTALTLIGYCLGGDAGGTSRALHIVTQALVGFCAVVIVVYVWRCARAKR
ncbi:MAG: DedA family protein [Synergistaceae bacterium]|jgi:membrane protein DedA with SNARE-associated domain|nr:DedA family protein [Synergistaceae bacterium]